MLDGGCMALKTYMCYTRCDHCGVYDRDPQWCDLCGRPKEARSPKPRGRRAGAPGRGNGAIGQSQQPLELANERR